MAKSKPAPTPLRPPEKTYDIPSVSFRVITDDAALLAPAGVHSEQARSYGYNDFSDFERPAHYIRYIEPIESELAVQVEYDMDEQDQEWLDAVNASRKKDQSGPVSYEVFEIIMDRLEKEWFNLIKRIPQPASHLPVEDSKCAICDDGEGENSNAIVFCDGCNLAVHQDCYGVPYIPEGQWLCRKCTVSPENPVSCLFCPNEGGAFKQTTTGHWSHLLCAIWIPELGVGNAIYMEPVEGVELVPKNRWKLVCSLCKERSGACIQCENKNCFTAFHVTCARQMGLLMSMKLMGSDGQLKAFCEKHLPADWRDARNIDDDDEDDTDYHDTDEDSEDRPVTPKRPRKNSTTTKTVTTKTARAHAKSYRPGPPIVPRLIVNKLVDYVAKLSIRKRQPFIEKLCRYWSLKREARRGAPLLKRLHLEPWTATSESKEQTDAQKAQKLEFLLALRNDLEKVRLLAELVRKREKEKLRQAQVIKEVVDNFIFPHYAALRTTLEKVVAMDRGELFFNPVNTAEVPDYAEVVKDPMSWSGIEAKLDIVAYLDVAEFKADINLVLDNAMLYNKSETPFHRTASRIKKNVKPLLDELDSIALESALMPDDERLAAPPSGSVGDLEVSLVRLQALLAPDATEPSRDLLASIFVSEIEKPKTRSPTPPPETAAEKKRLFEERDAAYKERLSLGVGSTRRSRGGPVDGLPTDVSSPMDVSTAPATPQEEEQPVAEPSRRRTTRQAPAGAIEEIADGETSARSSPGRIRPQARPQRGVLGLQSVAVVSDRERRQREKQLDLVADEIGAADEYKRFNVGWILPEGSKRRRAAPPPPPPKQKTRTPSGMQMRRSKANRIPASHGSRSSGKAPTGSPQPSERSKGRVSASAEPVSKPSKKRRAESHDSESKPSKRGRHSEERKEVVEELTPVPESAPTTAVEATFPTRGESLTPPPEEPEEPQEEDVKPTVESPAKEPESAEEEVQEEPAPAEEAPKDKPEASSPKKKRASTDDDFPPGTQGEPPRSVRIPLTQPSLGKGHVLSLLPGCRCRSRR
ncbi:hypothetical protein VHUM_02529 [Vanrija humicola]|uniref:PHD-type domain-containing protein n=1 Tax=Vanrija humicola TaxID=5417 RepID=A0A7D8UZ61_VANHU|nr:hypothetical protein VHUM_02529 [Vanrija humicola]